MGIETMSDNLAEAPKGPQYAYTRILQPVSRNEGNTVHNETGGIGELAARAIQSDSVEDLFTSPQYREEVEHAMQEAEKGDVLLSIDMRNKPMTPEVRAAIRGQAAQLKKYNGRIHLDVINVAASDEKDARNEFAAQEVGLATHENTFWTLNERNKAMKAAKQVAQTEIAA